MILDPILRFNWIFYAVFTGELQHSALLSFFVGFSEVCRRGIWTLFRVENEHCTNVGRFRASRDVPLPYDIMTPSPSTPEEHEPQTHPSPDRHRHPPPFQASPSIGSSSNLEAQPPSGSLRRRQTNNTPIQRGMARVGTVIAQAHAQDFEKKRRPDVPESASPYHGARTGPVESSDEEEEEEEHEVEEIEATGAPHAAGDDIAEETRAEDEQDVRDVRGADDILRRHRSAVE